VQGTIVCEEHAPQQVVTPPPAPVASGTSPGLAFVLGLIPGVGAIYNGQYAKGVVHVVIFGLLISVMSSGATGGFEPLFGLLIAIWYFYMPFEAYHTASRRQLGQPVDEFSSIFPLKTRRPGLPVGPVILMALGVLCLLATMDIIEFRQIARYWPVILIVLGAYMLYCRLTGSYGEQARTPDREAQNEQH
jgi:TM2 domain-containing membrane protein YozV